MNENNSSFEKEEYEKKIDSIENEKKIWKFKSKKKNLNIAKIIIKT